MKTSKQGKAKPPQSRFGIGEWYGNLFTQLSAEARRDYGRASLARSSAPIAQGPQLPCPFGPKASCNKKSGACSFRLYQRSHETGEVRPVDGVDGRLRTFCPRRFEEDGIVYEWIGQKILGCERPYILKEVAFLESPSDTDDSDGKESVGRIDRILLVPEATPLKWCAVEFQAVYFSGKGMNDEFLEIINNPSGGIAFPVHHRRPDWRSSGPKRLMPQLQIKIPTLRRWGKKMAVVVDDGFFGEFGKNMRDVHHISNCDVAWFVVRYEEHGQRARLVPDSVHLTTLEDSVEGLTAGLAVSMEVFEERILTQLKGLSGPSKITSD